MKLSELQALCEKAIAKHGDMAFGVHPKEDADEVSEISNCYGEIIHLRILDAADDLPGKSVDEEPEAPEVLENFAVFFYE